MTKLLPQIASKGGNAALLLLGLLAMAAQASADAPWSNVPSASDDRYTNPKSAVYAGPNGWYNFGELRSQLGEKAAYSYKGGLNVSTDMVVLVSSQQPTQVLSLDFGVDPDEQMLAPGSYTVSATADYAQRQVKVGFGDSGGGKIVGWASESGAGTVVVSHVEGFVYLSARGLKLTPSMVYNKGDNASVLVVGFEGAIKP